MPRAGTRGWAIYDTHARRAAIRASQGSLHPELAPLPRPDWTPDDWATPWPIVRDLEAEFGAFTLDPCATEASAKAPSWYGTAQDGLRQPWRGRVFCNPPYSNVPPWIEKAIDAAEDGALVVMLLPAKVDRHWFHDLVLPNAEVRFMRGRTHFVGADGTTTGRPLFSAMLAIFRPSTAPPTRPRKRRDEP